MVADASLFVHSQLAPDEQILWTGTPPHGILFRSSDVYMIPFSLMWGGFAIFWEMGVLGSQITFFSLWGIPFVLAGLYMIVGRFFVDARVWSGTYYAATNQRIIIVSGLFGRKIKSLNLRTLTDISMEQRNDGFGTITFGSSAPHTAFMRGSYWPGASSQVAPAFERIQDVSTVYNLIRQAQKAA